jgi:hypothetical protein
MGPLAAPLPAAINGSVAAPGYKDQAAAFPAGSTVWFYFIWGAAPGLNVITSLSPPTSGPTFPPGYGYTNYAPAFPLALDSSGNVQNVPRVRGDKVYYLNDGPHEACGGNSPPCPAAGTPITFDFSPYVPTAALSVDIYHSASAWSLAAGTITPVIAGLITFVVPTLGYDNLGVYVQAPGSAGSGSPGEQDVISDTPLSGNLQMTAVWYNASASSPSPYGPAVADRYNWTVFIKSYRFANGG